MHRTAMPPSRASTIGRYRESLRGARSVHHGVRVGVHAPCGMDRPVMIPVVTGGLRMGNTFETAARIHGLPPGRGPVEFEHR